MELTEFPHDFSEFLKLLIAHGVEYLLVGGFAVAIHGYPRATSDLDVWVKRDLPNAKRIEVLTSIDGVNFTECVERSIIQIIDGSEVRVIGLADLKINKLASGRKKDLADLENLP